MKKFRVLSFILSFVLALSVCGCTKDINEKSEDLSLALVNKNGQYYIQLGNVSVSDEGLANSESVEYIHFSSMDEFYTRVTEMDFSEEELKKIRGFRKDENGIIVCDMDNLYRMVLPNDVTLENIAWYGDGYATVWSSSSVAKGSAFLYNSEKRFENTMRDTFSDDIFDRDDIEVLNYTETQNSDYEIKKWTYNYITEEGSFKSRTEVYDGYNNGMRNKIIIKYALDRQANYESGSDSIPKEVNIFTQGDDWYCWNVMIGVESPLDIDWLMSFGIEPYVAS